MFFSKSVRETWFLGVKFKFTVFCHSVQHSDTYGSHAILDRAMILQPNYKRKDFQMATMSGERKLSYAEYYRMSRRRTSASDSGEDSSDTAMAE